MLKWILTSLAVVGALSAVLLAREGLASRPVPALLNAPAQIPFEKSIAGAGTIEPASESIAIGVSEPGLVMNVYVQEGQHVKAGDALFKIDTRGIEGELLTARAAVSSAEAEFDRVVAETRKEDISVARAKLDEANSGIQESSNAEMQAQASISEREWNLKDNQQRMERLALAVKSNATPEEQLDRARFAIKICEAQLNSARATAGMAHVHTATMKAHAQQAQAELDKLLADPWGPDVKKAKAAIEEARSRVAKLNLELERRIVRAPLDADVIRLNLRPGEYATANNVNPENAGVVLGDMKSKHVRVDIDEFDAPRLKPELPAAAFLKGDSAHRIPLEFVRVEPFIVPKRALSNSQHELVDTRVLQAVYRIVNPQMNVYAGQQVDVYINAGQ